MLKYSLLVFFATVSFVNGQEQFDSTFLDKGSFAVFTINVKEMASSYSDSPNAEEAGRFIESMGLKLNEFDHFQMIFSGPTDKGPDNAVHDKVVLSIPRELDAELAEKLTLYPVEETIEIEGQQFLAPDGRSAWGAFQGADNVAVVAVQRKARALLANLAEPDCQLAQLIQSQNKAVDANVVVIVNEHTADFARQMFGGEEYAQLFDLIVSVELSFDFDSENYVFGKAVCKTKEDATQLASRLLEIIKMAIASTEGLLVEVKEMHGENPEPGTFGAEFIKQFSLLKKALEAIKVKSQGNHVTLNSQCEGGLRDAFELFLKQIMNDRPWR